MKHSRPGFATRTNDATPAKLNDDMVPAINRAACDASTPLKTNGPSLEAMLEAHKHDHALAQSKAPQVLVNPHPSATPQVNEPGK